MRTVFGLKVHSGGAVLVVLAEGPALDVVETERLEPPRRVLARASGDSSTARGGADSELFVGAALWARRQALETIESALSRRHDAGDDVAACGLLVPRPIPLDPMHMTVSEVGWVLRRRPGDHEWVLREALRRAVDVCGLPLVTIVNEDLLREAERALSVPPDELLRWVARLGKTAVPTWGEDGTDAALAAMIALQRHRGATLPDL